MVTEINNVQVSMKENKRRVTPYVENYIPNQIQMQF